MRKKNVTLRNKEIQYLPILNQVTALSDIQCSFSLWPRVQIFVLFPFLLLMLLSFTHSGVLVLISPIPEILTLPYSACTKTTKPQHVAQTHLPSLILFWFPKWKWPLTRLNYHTFCTLTWNYSLYLVIGLCILHSSTWV